MLSTNFFVSLISISRQPPLFLWRSSRTAADPGVLGDLVLLVSFGFLDSDVDIVDIVAVEESQQFSYFSADSVRVPLHQS